ncbi:SsrA-binding protein SmpB [Elusimicrobiota bacterium]
MVNFSKQTTIIQNRKAFHNYEMLFEIEAGVQLLGPEVKSLRARRVSIEQGFIKIEGGEVFLCGVRISPYENTTYFDCDPVRKRKLLLKKMQINDLAKKVDEKGYTIIPLKIYIKNGLVKVLIAAAKGKTKADKRETLKKKIVQREIDREHKVDNRKYI